MSNRVKRYKQFITENRIAKRGQLDETPEDFNKFESSTMPESDINKYIEIINDIFTDISDVWNIEYQRATFDSGENSIDSDYDSIYIQIEIDNKIDKVKFIDDIFLFTEKVKSFTGLKEEYWVAGNKYNAKSSVLREFSKKSNNGEYLSIAFFFDQKILEKK